MGSESWWQWVPFHKTVEATLERAKRATLAKRGLDSVEQAYMAADAVVEFCDVLDVRALSSRRTAGKCRVLSPTASRKLFGAAVPTRAVVEAGLDRLFETMGRGESACVVTYARGRPTEVLFAGWTVD